MIELYIILIISAMTAILAVLSSYQLIQHYQLRAYHIGEYYKNIKTSLILRLALESLIIFVLTFSLMSVFDTLGGHFYLLGISSFTVLMIVFSILQFIKKYKTPLKITHRIIRFFIVLIFVNFVFWFGIIYAFYFYIPALSYSIIGLAPIMSYFLCGIAAAIAAPLEAVLRSKYIYLAKKKLASMPDLKIIGITGSFGKTSVKFILQKLLEGRYKVCASPNSFNTPMGLCRSINQHLKPDDQIFIAEMGARKKGDITKLCAIAPPDIAVITAIGEQHLATFKNIETVARAKYEIIQNLKPDGLAAFNHTSPKVLKLFQKTKHNKIIIGAFTQEVVYFAYYSNPQTFNRGSRFSLTIDGKTIDCVTALLGLPNIGNIALAAALAYKLGASLEEIAQKITELKPIPHRLQLIESGGGLTIIDDSFNANLEGAKAALDVLKSFLQKKIVITAGLVDMGKRQKSVNEELGKHIARAADWCIITGPNSLYIYDGLIKENFSIKRIRICDNLDQAVNILNSIPGSKVALFQNDLPDNY
ncbi:MAG TPA: UDP-N-acetylmuramoyl-tripeptide--D-alanyl-D-alanine ligase [Clostridiales bacterium]|nr:UDP-N-acetylmuramoyl-tripeptide--D-alanyl-D-alanine ligase [Clostridiales bacterium]